MRHSSPKLTTDWSNHPSVATLFEIPTPNPDAFTILSWPGADAVTTGAPTAIHRVVVPSRCTSSTIAQLDTTIPSKNPQPVLAAFRMVQVGSRFGIAFN